MTPEADDVDADIRAEQDMDLPSVSEWIEHGLAAAEDLSAAYHEGRDGPGGLNVGTMRAHIDAITAAFEAIRADTTRPSDTASLATTREACLHEDEDFGRGSAIVRVNDDRYECAVCGQRFRLVPGYAPWLYPVTSETALGLPDDWLNAAAGAALASALVAANYGGDSGEDVDRLVAELGKRGYVVVPEARPSDAASLAAAPSEGDDTVALALWDTTDAMEWAIAFNRLYPQPDVDTMLGWFANAIERGRAAGLAAALPAPVPALLDQFEAAIRADTPPPLDVARLRLAINNSREVWTHVDDHAASIIAAEYARLAEDTEAGS